jgi:signal peptidase I
MTVRTREGVRHVRGWVRVQVRDNRPRDSEEGDPDAIAVQFFVPDRQDPVFTYRGAVMRGDILVFRHER